MKEVWKEIIGYDKKYEVSNLGRIKSCAGGKYKYDRLLKGSIKNNGYILVCLLLNKKKVYKLIHRLVAEYFIDNPENKKEVDHINNIKTDNRVSNLRWVTGYENRSNKNSKQYPGRKVVQYTLSMEYVRVYKNAYEAAKTHNIDSSGIRGACKGRMRYFKGFIWKYK